MSDWLQELRDENASLRDTVRQLQNDVRTLKSIVNMDWSITALSTRVKMYRADGNIMHACGHIRPIVIGSDSRETVLERIHELANSPCDDCLHVVSTKNQTLNPEAQ